MDLCGVHYFLAVCERGSFTAASKACGVSQPAVTTGVHRLERSLGAKLFERRHPVRLTAFGKRMHPLLQTLQAAAERVGAAAARHREGKPVPPADEASLGIRRAGETGTARGRADVAPHLAEGSRPFFEPSDRFSDLLVRSSIAIELSKRAIKKSERLRAGVIRGTASRADRPASNEPTE